MGVRGGYRSAGERPRTYPHNLVRSIKRDVVATLAIANDLSWTAAQNVSNGQVASSEIQNPRISLICRVTRRGALDAYSTRTQVMHRTPPARKSPVPAELTTIPRICPILADDPGPGTPVNPQFGEPVVAGGMPATVEMVPKTSAKRSRQLLQRSGVGVAWI